MRSANPKVKCSAGGDGAPFHRAGGSAAALHLRAWPPHQVGVRRKCFRCALMKWTCPLVLGPSLPGRISTTRVAHPGFEAAPQACTSGCDAGPSTTRCRICTCSRCYAPAHFRLACCDAMIHNTYAAGSVHSAPDPGDFLSSKSHSSIFCYNIWLLVFSS